MPVDPNKRAETSRANGAKSKGPATPEGRDKCAQAASKSANLRRAIALSFGCTLLPNESKELLDSITQQELAYWQPASPGEIQMVQELIDINWRIKRARFAQNHALAHSADTQRLRDAAPDLHPGHVAQALIEAVAPGGDQLNFDRAVHLLTASRTRILRDLQRAQRRFPNRAGSQPVLQTNNFAAEFEIKVPDPAPPAPVAAWAQTSFDFTPDPVQTEILATEANDVLVLGARQTGKSTAAAIRALHEAVHNDNATILVAAPSARQSGHIANIARRFAIRAELELKPPPAGCEGFQLANGSAILSLPDNDITIRGFSAPRLVIVDDAAYVSSELIAALRPMLAISNGRLMQLSTANRKSGYFYQAWTSKQGPWHRIEYKAEACPRLTPEKLSEMKGSMTEDEYAREFACEFRDEETGIPPELFRRNLRPGFPPGFPLVPGYPEIPLIWDSPEESRTRPPTGGETTGVDTCNR